MLSFQQWIHEAYGITTGTYYNDEILQSKVNSNFLARVNKKELSDGAADCNFLGKCSEKRSKLKSLKNNKVKK